MSVSSRSKPLDSFLSSRSIAGLIGLPQIGLSTIDPINPSRLFDPCFSQSATSKPFESGRSIHSQLEKSGKHHEKGILARRSNSATFSPCFFPGTSRSGQMITLLAPIKFSVLKPDHFPAPLKLVVAICPLLRKSRLRASTQASPSTIQIVSPRSIAFLTAEYPYTGTVSRSIGPVPLTNFPDSE